MRAKCNHGFWILLLLLGSLVLPVISMAKETAQQWEIVNPQGIVKSDPVQIVPHPSSLEGKTVMLRWNGKPNGDHLLSRVGELLTEKVKGVKVIKSWEVAPETRAISYSQDRSKALAKKILSYKPDLVIGAPAD